MQARKSTPAQMLSHLKICPRVCIPSGVFWLTRMGEGFTFAQTTQSLDIKMEKAPQSVRMMRFGVFEVDLRSGELRKQGVKVKLQEQPFHVLVILLEHAGEVMTREELCRRVWPKNTFVDFEHSLATAINKIREALGDTAQNPRFIETLPKRGYRFIAAVEPLTSASSARTDSRAIDYVVKNAGVSNIFQQSITGGPPVQVTHYDSGSPSRATGNLLLLAAAGRATWF